MKNKNCFENANSAIHGFGLTMFSNDELDRLHESTLYVLDKIGLEVYQDEAKDLFAQGGCRVNRSNNTVQIPPYVVENCLKKCPPYVNYRARNPNNDFIAGGHKVGFLPFGVGLEVRDIETDEVRKASLKDVGDAFRMCDALEGVDILISLLAPHDVPEETFELYVAVEGFKNSSKHLWNDSINGKIARAQIQMAEMIVGGTKELKKRPIMSLGVCPVSPLKLPPEATEVIIAGASYGLPVNVMSMAMSGASAPMSLAGTLVVHNAEVLAGMVLAQLVGPGTEFIYSSSTTTFDMKHSAATVGAPEFGLLNAAIAQIARYYKIPSLVGGT